MPYPSMTGARFGAAGSRRTRSAFFPTSIERRGPRARARPLPSAGRPAEGPFGHRGPMAPMEAAPPARECGAAAIAVRMASKRSPDIVSVQSAMRAPRRLEVENWSHVPRAEVPDGGVGDGESASTPARATSGGSRKMQWAATRRSSRSPHSSRSSTGAQAVARPGPTFDLVPALGEVGMDASPRHPRRESADLPEERPTAGIGGMGGEVAPDPTARVVGERAGEVHRLVERRAPDRGIVPARPLPRATAAMSTSRMRPPTTPRSPISTRGLRERLRMQVVVDHRRRAGPEELERPEPREGEHLLEGERRALGDPRRVGGGVPQVLHHPAGEQ